MLVLFSFAGCKNEEPKNKTSVDISYYAKLGLFPESEIKIGDSVPKEGGDDTFYFVKAGARSFFSNGNFNYYYNPSSLEQKVFAVAAFSNFYGFEPGAVSIEVSDALTGSDIKYTERAATEDELFFLPAGENRSVIECNFEDRKLLFVFENNSLCAAYLS